MDGIKDALGRLSELNEAELSDLESQIISEFESVEAQELTQQTVDSMTELADALETVRTEQGTRAEKQQELQALAEAAASRIHPPEAEAADMMEDGEEEELEPEAPVDEETEEEEETEPVFSSDSDATASVQTEEAAQAQAETAPEAEAAVEEKAPEAELAAAPTTEAEAAADVEKPAEASVEAEASAVDSPESEASDNTPIENEQEETAVAASAADVTVASKAAAAPSILRAPTVITAGADIAGVTAGTQFENKSDVTDAFMKRLHALRRVTGGNGERHVVASIHAEYPEERKLYSGDQTNWSKIQDATGRQALTASAGCAPLETDYSIFGVGETDRPVRDALPKFNADRGGIRFYPGPGLPDLPEDGTGAIGIWDVTGAVTAPSGADLSGVKPSFNIVCPAVQEVTVEAVSTSLTFNNLTSRAFPELVEANTDLVMVQHARICEKHVLSAIEAGGTAVAAPDFTVGTAREFLAQVDLVASAMRYKHRLSDNQTLRVFAPYWLRDMFRADIAMQAPGDGLESLSVTDALINDALRRRGINLTWSMESATGPTPATTGFPATVEWDIFAEGTWLYLDGGTLDLGVIRDSTLVGANDYMEFAEEFFAVAQIGNDSWHITSTLDVAGVAAALFQDTFS